MHDQASDPGGDLISRQNVIRTAAFRQIKTVGFLPNIPGLSIVHDYTCFGAQYWPCILDPPGFGLPLLGLPSGFTTALLAKL